MKKFKNILPGLILVLFIYFIAIKIDSFLVDSFGIAIEVLTIGIILGMFVNNIFKIPSKFKNGIRFSLKSLLKLGIILLGFKLNFLALKALGGTILLGILFFVPSVLILSIVLGKFFKIENRLAALIGVGSCICGTSAIVAISPLIGAEDEEAVISVAIVSFLGAIGVLAYTAISSISSFSNIQFGIWSGLSLQGVAHALAAAFARGSESGEIGTFVKMARVVMLVPVSIILGFAFKGKNEETKIQVPYYVFLFIIAGVINSVVQIPETLSYILTKGSSIFISMAMISMGLSVHFKSIMTRGKKSMVLGLLLFLMIASSTYFMIWQFI
jgi:uncharacterized integral membrane protein (TIGR00698 family)